MALNPAPPNAAPRYELPTPAADTEEFFHAYSRQLYRYCLGRLKSPEEAEDAVQVTYLNAWRSLQRGTHPVDPRRWLFAIATNVCTTALRTRLRGANIEVRAPEDFERLPAPRPGGDELVDLDAALKALPARQREALLLRDWRGLSYEEIAGKLDASQPAVEMLLFRARQAVATALGRPSERAGRAPLRSALSALVLWPSGLKSVSAGLKSSLANLTSALPGGAAAVKAVGVAMGAIAPLVAYGVFEYTVGKEVGSRPPKTASSAAAGLGLDAQQSEARPPVRRASRVPSIATAPKAKGAPRGAGERKGDRAAVLSAAASGAVGSDPGTPAGSGTDQTSQTPPAPSEPDTPSGTGPAAEKVLVCHHTGSKNNPSVAITVGKPGTEAHLARGDLLGPCAG